VNSASTDLLAACAAYGLASSHRFPSGPLSAAEFSILLASAEHHRLVGFLGAAVRDGALAVDADQRAALEEVLEGWLAHSLRVEALLLAAAEQLETAGVSYRVFKGVAVANTVYAEPSLRVFADVDVLVPSVDFGRAAQVLESALGADRALPELRPGFDARFGREAMLRSDNGLELDIHRTFVDGAFGLTVELDDLFASPRTFALGRRDVPTLPPARQLLSSCYAAALGDWPSRLASQRDVVQLLNVQTLSTEDVLELAHSWRAEAVVARALCAAWEELVPRFTPPLVDWARSFRPTPLDRLLLASYRGPARGFTSKAAAVLVIPGITDKLAYLRAMALPQRVYLEQRGLSPGGHLGRALARVRQRQ
jgi:putative nucleotidyltransferase-like protein